MKKDIGIENLRQALSPCCEMSAAPVGSSTPEGRALISQFQRDARTVLVVAHHVKTSVEWTWFPLESERRGQTCAADLHAQAVIENAGRMIESSGFESVVLPYPGSCGIAFKKLAALTGMGEIGDNYMFLHPKWGPWVHLRVLLTDAVIVSPPSPKPKETCTHCYKCIEACPAQALQVGKIDQAACDRFQAAERERLGITVSFYNKCESCVRSCPIGEEPAELVPKTLGG